MAEKEKISSLQMGLLMYPTVLATGFLALPTITAQYAKNDLWLTSIVAAFAGLIAVYASTRLHELYPKQTVIQYSGRIIGRIPGKIIGLIYCLYLLHATGAIARQYADFVRGNYLSKTPILLIISTMVLLTAISLRGGVEVLARSAVLFTPFFILPIFILLFLIPDLDVKNLFPILSHGIVPVLKGSVTPLGWVSELFIMTFFLPSLADPAKGRKAGLLALAAIVVSMSYVNLISLFLLGVDTGDKTYPVLVAFRYIRIGELFENMEALLLAMWVVGNFVKIGVFFYAATISLEQWLNLSNFRHTIFPVGLLIVIFSLWGIPDYSDFSNYLKLAAPFELAIVFTLIPLLLLLVAALRKKKSGARP